MSLADHGIRAAYLASPRGDASLEDIAKDPAARWVPLYPELVRGDFRGVRTPATSVRAETLTGVVGLPVIAINTGQPVLVFRDDDGKLNGAVITVLSGKEWSETIKRWIQAGEVLA